MKVRVRDKVANNGLGAVADSSASVAGSIQLQSDLGRAMNAKDHGSNDDQMVAAAKIEQKSELESRMPVTLRCLSAVSGVDENVLITLLKDAVLKKVPAERNSASAGKMRWAHPLSSRWRGDFAHLYGKWAADHQQLSRARILFWGGCTNQPGRPRFLGELKGRLHHCFNIPGTLHRRRNVTPRFASRVNRSTDWQVTGRGS